MFTEAARRSSRKTITNDHGIKDSNKIDFSKYFCASMDLSFLTEYLNVGTNFYQEQVQNSFYNISQFYANSSSPYSPYIPFHTYQLQELTILDPSVWDMIKGTNASYEKSTPFYINCSYTSPITLEIFLTPPNITFNISFACSLISTEINVNVNELYYISALYAVDMQLYNRNGTDGKFYLIMYVPELRLLSVSGLEGYQYSQDLIKKEIDLMFYPVKRYVQDTI